MKKVTIILIALIGLFANAETITMIYENGVYKIPCTVNGAKMKFIFDTGASDVAISMPMAEYLYENDYIDDNDLIGTGQSVVADGRIVNHLIINLKDVQIGNSHLTNVRAIVTENLNAPLLLGQSALRKLGEYTIEGNLLTIKNSSDNLDEMEFEDIAKLAHEHYEYKRYDEAIRLYKYLYDLDALNDYGLFDYAFTLSFADRQEDAIRIYKSLLNSETFSRPKDNLVYDQLYNIYERIAWCFIRMNDDIAARFYVNKAIEFVNDYRLKSTISQNYANSLSENENYYEASNYYWKAFCDLCYYHDINPKNAYKYITGENKQVMKLKTDILDIAYFYTEAIYYDMTVDYNTFAYVTKRLASMDCKFAKRFCNQNYINY